MELNGYVYEYQGKSPAHCLNSRDSMWDIARVGVDVKRFVGVRTIDGGKVSVFEGTDGCVYACTRSAVREQPGHFKVVVTRKERRVIMTREPLTEYDAFVLMSKLAPRKGTTYSVEKVT